MRESRRAPQKLLARSLAWASLCASLLGRVHLAAAAAEEAQPSGTVPAQATLATPAIETGPAETIIPTAPPPQVPMSPAARAFYDRGLELYSRHEYRAAALELRRGFLVEPRPEFIFGEAQAWRLAGDCERALILYREFVASQPPPLQVQAARLGMDRCGPERESRRPPPAIALAPIVPLAPPPDDARPLPGTRGWWRDPWAVAASGVGAVALGTGLGFALASNSARDQANDAAAAQAGTYAEYAELWETAGQRRTVAVSAIVGGLVLMGVGVTRFVLLHQREAKPATAGPAPGAVSISVAAGAGSLVWRGAF